MSTEAEWFGEKASSGVQIHLMKRNPGLYVDLDSKDTVQACY